MALRSLISISKNKQSLLGKNTNMLWIRRQEKSNTTPMGGWFGNLFKMKTIKDNWETIPLFIAAFIQASLPVIHSAWRLTVAEDITFFPRTKMKNQTHRYILEGPPKPTKYVVINQVWEWPEGLLKALKGDENSDECEKEVEPVSNKFWKKKK